MKRIKNLGLAMVLAMALTAALGAAGASASLPQLETESSPVTLSSTNPFGKHNWFFYTANRWCDAPSLSAKVGEPTWQFEVSATDAECYAQYTGYQLKMNGCKLMYHLGKQIGNESFAGTVDIVPAGCGPISFASGASYCQVTVPSQTGLGKVTFENLGKGTGNKRTIKLTHGIGGMKHSQVSGEECGAALGTFEEGQWFGSWELKGTTAGGFPDGIWLTGEGWTEPPPLAVSITGTPPKFVGSAYPITLAGPQSSTAKHVFDFPGTGKAKCGTANLKGYLNATTSQLPIFGEYGTCEVLGFSGSVVMMNGCSYTFNVLNQPPVGGAYAGHADISCPTGKSIELVAYAGIGGTLKCTITIPAQTTDSGGLTLTNATSTSIKADLAIKGIDYHTQEGTGLGRCKTGDFTEGTYTGSSTLVASY
ncbi:MAG: hypothetical protein WA862_10855 [Solirubrobacterales bacterium]